MSRADELVARYEGEGLPVLIIHGWEIRGSVEAGDFEPIFEKKAGYRRIYIDLPGMGETPANGIENLDSIFDRLRNFIIKNIPTNFLLIGSSCGAYLARALAYEFAPRVDGLLLRVPVVDPLSSNRDVDPFSPVIADPKLMETLSDQDRENFGDVPVQTPEYIDILRRRMEDAILPAVAAADSAVLDSIRNDPTRYRLTKPMHTPSTPLTKPTLILTGRQDTSVGYRDSWSLMNSYPRATFIALDRASHALPVDETHLFEALVVDWLTRVEESRTHQSVKKESE